MKVLKHKDLLEYSSLIDFSNACIVTGLTPIATTDRLLFEEY